MLAMILLDVYRTVCGGLYMIGATAYDLGIRICSRVLPPRRHTLPKQTREKVFRKRKQGLGV